MPPPKYAAQVGNIIFLTRIGSTLRWATSDIVDEELPAEVKLLLRRLDRLEAKAKAAPPSRDDITSYAR